MLKKISFVILFYFFSVHLFLIINFNNHYEIFKIPLEQNLLIDIYKKSMIQGIAGIIPIVFHFLYGYYRKKMIVK